MFRSLGVLLALLIPTHETIPLTRLALPSNMNEELVVQKSS